jgi:hypothetical protein
MNIIQFWIVDTIVKVGPGNNKIQEEEGQTTTNQSQTISNHDQPHDEHSPLLPK